MAQRCSRSHKLKIEHVAQLKKDIESGRNKSPTSGWFGPDRKWQFTPHIPPPNQDAQMKSSEEHPYKRMKSDVGGYPSK